VAPVPDAPTAMQVRRRDVDSADAEAVRTGLDPAPGATPSHLDPLGLVEKHGSHDQKSHGNWARGAGSLKGDFNPRGSEPITTSPGDPLGGYLEVNGVDLDTVEAVQDAFEGEWGGLRSQVTSVSGTHDGGNVHVVGHVLDEDDEMVGEFVRDIFPGEKEVSHQSLFLSSQVQGRGFAKGFLTQSEAHYRAQGMESVYVQASDAVGGYAWAKAGFDWADGHPSPSVRESLEDFIRHYPQHRLTPTVNEWLNGDDGDWPSPHDIATLGEGTDDFEFSGYGVRGNMPEMVHAGAYIMLGTEWDGEKVLNTVQKAVYLDDLSDDDWAWIERACAEGRVQKYSDSQPRDEQGRWTDGNGVIVATKPEWSPTMTRENAEHWAKDSKIQQVLTHTTPRDSLRAYWGNGATGTVDLVHVDGPGWVAREFAEKVDGEWRMKPDVKSTGILDVGFDPTRGGGVFGPGTYLGMEEFHVGQEYPDGWNRERFDAWPGGSSSGEKFPGMVEAIEDRQAREYGYGADREMAPTLRVMVDVRKPLHVDGKDGNRSDLNSALIREGHNATTDPVTRIRELGYDALVITDVDKEGFDWQVGGDQVVVWDKTKMTVLVDEQGNIEDHRFRKYSDSQARAPRGAYNGGQWVRSNAADLSRSTSIMDVPESKKRSALPSNEEGVYYRVHHAGDPFSDKAAWSKAFTYTYEDDISGGRYGAARRKYEPFFDNGYMLEYVGPRQKGFSSYSNPWHVAAYMSGREEWANSGDTWVVAYKGKPTSERGYDNEPLVVPDGKGVTSIVERMSWGTFKRRLRKTPVGDRPNFGEDFYSDDGYLSHPDYGTLKVSTIPKKRWKADYLLSGKPLGFERVPVDAFFLESSGFKKYAPGQPRDERGRFAEVARAESWVRANYPQIDTLPRTGGFVILRDGSMFKVGMHEDAGAAGAKALGLTNSHSSGAGFFTRHANAVRVRGMGDDIGFEAGTQPITSQQRARIVEAADGRHISVMDSRGNTTGLMWAPSPAKVHEVLKPFVAQPDLDAYAEMLKYSPTQPRDKDGKFARVLMDDGREVQIVAAHQTPRGIEFEDTLGKRWPASKVISYKPVEKYSASQPRDELGRWTDGLGTVTTGDVDAAITALGEGHKVVLDRADKVTVLLDRLRVIVAEATRLGKKAPTYDLCNVTVPGTNIFCGEHKGLPRQAMPQLKGVPLPGSRAASFPADERGEVSLNDEFRKHLLAKGVVITDENIPAAWLKATQRELNGAKVAGIAKAYTEGKLAKERLFISGDEYIVDGHHRWASILGTDLADNVPGDHLMEVAQVHMPILDLVAEANTFASEWGIPQAGMTSGFGKALDPFELVEKYDPNQPRDPKGSPTGGRWSSNSGSSTGIGSYTTGLDAHTATQHLQRLFPKAVIDGMANLDQGARDGLVTGFDRMAKEWPNIAENVVLVRAVDEVTEGMAEHIITTVRKPMGLAANGYPNDPIEVTGHGFLFDVSKNNHGTGIDDGYAMVIDTIVGNDVWGPAPEYPQRSNSFSIDSHAAYVESNVVHEWAHAVHNTSTAAGLDEQQWGSAGKNRRVWEDAAYPGTLGPPESENQALAEYRDYAMNSNILPPTGYAGNGHIGELFAESFTVRHGPEGVGVMNSAEPYLDPELERIVAKIEEDARW
jgi:hypothetical protein